MSAKKISISYAFILLSLSCQSPSKISDTDELCGSRDPASAGMCSQVFSGENKVLPLLTDPEALVQYKETNTMFAWEKWLETDVDYMAFYHKSHFEKGIAKKHATEIYGLENYKAYVSARDYLNQIRIGEFQLTRSLIMKVHDLGAEGIKKQSWMMGKLLPKNMSTGNSTGLKARTNYGADPLTRPLAEDQYQALKNNPWIGGFKELPWPLSRKNKRRGLIVYADPATVPSRLRDLEVWYHKNKDSMDPVALAAEFQYRFVSIHPFIDGNGRTAMLIANRILRERQYPGIVQNFPNFDIYYSLKDWTEVLRAGVAEYASLTREVRTGTAPTIHEANHTEAARTAILPEFAMPEKLDKLNNMNKKLAEKFEWRDGNIGNDYNLIRIGRQQFVMLNDGFFYDFHGIPHVLHENKLYPVADRTYLLYAENGALKEQRYSRRALTVDHRDVYRTHFRYLKDLESERIRPKDIEVIPYDKIQSANEKGEIYLFPWQVQLFRNAITIRDQDPLSIMAHTRGYTTTFEQNFFMKQTVSMPDVVAQYQYLEVKYQRYLEFADKMQNSEWRNLIMQSRETYFKAAKMLLEIGFRQERSLPYYERQVIAQSPRWNFLKQYIQQTNLAYPTLQQALGARGDTHIVLLRSDMNSSQYLGFNSNQTYLEVAKTLPGYQKFQTWVKEYVKVPAEERKTKKKTALEAQLTKSIPGFDKLANRIHEVIKDNPYDERGVHPAFDREFVDHHLHADNTALKRHVSLSTSTDLYFHWMGDGTNTNGPFLAEGVKGKIFMVRMNKSKVASTIATPYEGEYEILSQKRIGAQKIVDSVDFSFFKAESKERYQEINDVVERIIEIDPTL